MVFGGYCFNNACSPVFGRDELSIPIGEGFYADGRGDITFSLFDEE